MLGRLLAERGVRDGVVLATTYGFAAGGGPVSGGSGRANMTRAGEGSLRRLGTDRIDVYWMHLWDGFTPADKVLHGMVDLVRAGKIRHYGFSNMPAWFVVEAATLARAHGIPGPAALQLEYSLVSRDIEREHVRAAQEMGLGMVPWSPLAGGFLSGQSHREEQRTPNSGRLSGANPFGDSKFTERTWDILETLRDVAAALDRTPAKVAQAWLLGRPAVDTVLVGARTPDQLGPALAAVETRLPDDPPPSPRRHRRARPGLPPCNHHRPDDRVPRGWRHPCTTTSRPLRLWVNEPERSPRVTHNDRTSCPEEVRQPTNTAHKDIPLAEPEPNRSALVRQSRCAGSRVQRSSRAATTCVPESVFHRRPSA